MPPRRKQTKRTQAPILAMSSQLNSRNANSDHESEDLSADENLAQEKSDSSDDSTVRDRLLPPGQHTSEIAKNKRRIQPTEEDDKEEEASIASSVVVKSDDSNDEDFHDEDDSEEEEQEEEESEEDVEDTKTRSRRGRKSKPSRNVSAKKSNSKPAARALSSRRSSRRSRSTRTQTNKRPPLESSDSSEVEMELVDRTPRKSVAASRGSRSTSRSKRAALESEDEDEDEESDASVDETPILSRSGRAQRSSARKALQNVSKLARLDNSKSSDEEEEEEPKKPPPKRKRRDEDDDFIVDDEEEVEEEDVDSNVEDEDDFEGSDNEAVNIDNEQIGDQDTSDDEAVATPKKGKLYSPVLAFDEISPSPRKERGHLSESDESSANQEVSRRRSILSQIEDCPSVNDPITANRLPKRHVCFISRHGSRQCFALSTLHKIATTMDVKFRVDNSGDTKQTFLQPPHFRSEMSDELLDQLASRFGREALDIDGAFYKSGRLARIEGGLSQEEDESNSDSGKVETKRNPFKDALVDNSDFLDQVQQFVKAQMGSQDLYVCPICMSVATTRFRERDFFAGHNKSPKEGKKDNVNDEDALRERYLSKRLQDPIAVLKALDSSYKKELQIASTFCCKRVSEIKSHIRNDHFLDTRNVEGNTLYARYKIRDQDGLLQRFLGTRGGQGGMMRYWFEGNNFDFVHLLCLVDRAQIFAQVKESEGAGEDEKKEARKYWSASTKYFESLNNVAGPLWELLSRPHLKFDDKQDIAEFMVDEDDGDDDEEDKNSSEGVSHRALDMDEYQKHQDEEEEANRKLVERLEKAVREEESEEEEERLDENDYEEEEEEEEDEWEQNIKSKRRVRSLKDKKKVGRPSRRKANDSDEDSAIFIQDDPETSAAKKRRVIEDDDDDDDE